MTGWEEKREIQKSKGAVDFQIQSLFVCGERKKMNKFRYFMIQFFFFAV